NARPFGLAGDIRADVLVLEHERVGGPAVAPHGVVDGRGSAGHVSDFRGGRRVDVDAPDERAPHRGRRRAGRVPPRERESFGGLHEHGRAAAYRFLGHDSRRLRRRHAKRHGLGHSVPALGGPRPLVVAGAEGLPGPGGRDERGSRARRTTGSRSSRPFGSVPRAGLPTFPRSLWTRRGTSSWRSSIWTRRTA